MYFTFTLDEKKKLFFKACKNAQKQNLKGEDFLDEVYSFIEDTYDRIDNRNGMSINEQWAFDKYCNKWLNEFREQEGKYEK